MKRETIKDELDRRLQSRLGEIEYIKSILRSIDLGKFDKVLAFGEIVIEVDSGRIHKKFNFDSFVEYHPEILEFAKAMANAKLNECVSECQELLQLTIQPSSDDAE